MNVAEGEVEAQRQRLAVAKAAIAEETWEAYFNALAATERLKLASVLESATESVAVTARGMAGVGLASDIDVDIAETVALRAVQERIRANQLVDGSHASLRLLTGSQADTLIKGSLEPLARPAISPEQRAEVLVAEQERAVNEDRVALIRRTRVPNPSLSVFAQNDGFNERVFGVGLSFPIPIPSPIGRTHEGTIAEAVALTERATADVDRIKRELQINFTLARVEYDASEKISGLYSPDRLRRARERLASIGAQLKAGRLPVRDALIAEQALVDQLRGDIDARESFCLASVRLVRASGQPFEGATP